SPRNPPPGVRPRGVAMSAFYPRRFCRRPERRVDRLRAMRLAVLVILVSGAARAWDPTDAASVDSRVQELKAAWEGKDPVAVANDKLQRARQGKKPAWVSRRAFRIDDGARRLYLGIG